MVKDIYAGNGNAYPNYLTAVGSTLYFRANDGVTGQELWKSDGTAAGTVLVKNIAAANSSADLNGLTAVGNTLYFIANDGIHGLELWKSNGTAAGTVMVKDIAPGSNGSTPLYLIAAGNTLYFVADDGTNGYELWKSDGTEAGTILVKVIVPGINPNDYPRVLTAMGGMLYFQADDGTHGYELWKSDGTEAGTVLVKDIRPGGGSSYPHSLTLAGGSLFFAANDGSLGHELWKSDGTEAGTVLAADITGDSGDSAPANLQQIGSWLFFSATTLAEGNELWKLWNYPLPAALLTTAAVSNLDTTTITLNGTVNPHGFSTTAFFEYGISANYGSIATVTLTPNNGSTAQVVSAALNGLQPGTLYHYRLTAINNCGTVSTSDAVFITLADGINVLGNDVVILNGDGTPGATDHTDYGNVALLNTQTSHTFTISNDGTSTLNLTGTPKVTISGAAAADFVVTAQPAQATLAAGGSTTFSIQFDPSLPGLRMATVSIANDDPGNNPFTFAIAGFGALKTPLPQTIMLFGCVGKLIASR